jgi:hypothetical protein
VTKAVTKAMAGRPTKYTEALGNEICERLAAGESLRSICRSAHMPDERRVRAWSLDENHPIAPRYARARNWLSFDGRRNH